MNILKKTLITVLVAVALSLPAWVQTQIMSEGKASAGTPAEATHEDPKQLPAYEDDIPGGAGTEETGGPIGPEYIPAAAEVPGMEEKAAPSEGRDSEGEEITTKAPEEADAEAIDGAISAEEGPGVRITEKHEDGQEQEKPSGAASAAGIEAETDGLPAPGPSHIEPLFVRSVTDISAGHNDYNPVWSPSGDMLAFERNIGGKREIRIVSKDGVPVSRVYYKLSEGEEEFDFFLPGINEEVSYNAGISWAKREDRIVFMSNAATGNYDVYVRELETEITVRLTEDAGKDGHADWSPAANLLVFVSGRSGKAELYLLDLVTKETFRLTYGEKSYLYPQWSPDGTKVAMIYGSNENHDIQVISDISKPRESVKSLTTWEYDDLRPVWSPDGKKIAFYTNYNADGDPKIWSIAVIDSDGSGPTEGEGLAARVVTTNVVPDVEQGPAWLPDNKRIAYVKNDEKRFNPIYIVNVEDTSEVLLNTDTKMNHDISCSTDGTLAFRAQVEQWDHIYIARPKEPGLRAWRIRQR